MRVCAKIYAGLIMLLQAEKAVAELRRANKALEAHIEAKACFMDAFDQLQNHSLVDGKSSYLVFAAIHMILFNCAFGLVFQYNS